ncbi:ABA4-like family protein [Ideonella sp. DXS29W]|uniref:ABA4-like family protein n=1 Tax=Ideonella lacteola TaxID=2984193 RepID=A0ABU9BXM9_9BURK
MTPERVFEGASVASLCGWAGLLFGAACPMGAARRWLLAWGGRVVPLALAAGYLGMLVAHWGSAPGGHFGSLDGVATLFASRGKLAGGWMHFLAFDLFVGRWIIDDTVGRGAPRWPWLLSLPLCLLYGPAGLLVHFLTRIGREVMARGPGQRRCG